MNRRDPNGRPPAPPRPAPRRRVFLGADPRLLLCLLGPLAACARPAAPEPPAPATAAKEPSGQQPATKAAPSPIDALPAGCELLLATTVDGHPEATLAAGGQLRLEAWVENRTSAAISLEFSDSCPGVDARFSGFGTVALYDRSCMQGACPPDSPVTRKLSVAPGARVRVDETTLRALMPCERTPVPPGVYPVSFSLSFVGTPPKSCSTSAMVTVP